MERMTKHKLGKSDGSGSDMPCASTDTTYSRSLNIPYAKTFCLSVRAKVSAGTPDVDLYLEQTHVENAAEGAAGDATSGWAQAEGAAKILDITDQNWHHLTVSPLALPKLRLKGVGQGTNPASCTLEAYLTQIEPIV